MENGDDGDARPSAHRDAPDGPPYRPRYVPIVEVHDPRPDRRFIIGLLAWAGVMDVASVGVWAKILVGAVLALALVIYCMVRVSRPMT